MSIPQLLICVCLAFQDSDFYQTKFDWQRPPAGFVVKIDPDQLIGEQLSQSWRTIDESYGKRHVRGKPFSKVKFNLSPMRSIEGAVLQLKLDGTSVGESSGTSSSVDITTDSLTKFTVEQKVFINGNRVSFGEPALKVNTKLSFNRATSKKNPFAKPIAKAAFRRFPENVNSHGEDFSRQQISRHLAQSNAQTSWRFNEFVSRFSSTYPGLAGLGWHLSSDDGSIYVSAYSNFSGGSSSTIPDAPVAIALHEAFVDDYLFQQLSEKRIRSADIELFYRKVGGNLKLPELTEESDKRWSITFSQTPATVSFDENRILFCFYSDIFEAKDRQLPGMEIRFGYEIHRGNDGWNLSLLEGLQIEGENSGARQQVLRSIMRRRIERVLPKTISLPLLNTTNRKNLFELDLVISKLMTRDHSLIMTLDHRQ